MPRVFTLLLLLGACQVAEAPRSGCTQRWCQEGLRVDFGEGLREPGAYRLTLVADGVSTTCHAKLPLPDCAAPPARCGPTGGPGDGTGVTVETSGCALPAAQHALIGLRSSVIPRHIRVQVEGPGGRMQFEGTPAPSCSHPNGPTCDPRPCCAAQVSLRGAPSIENTAGASWPQVVF